MTSSQPAPPSRPPLPPGAPELAAERRRLRFTGREIERRTRLPSGIVSAVERGHKYPHPKFRGRVTALFAAETGEPFQVVHMRLFPGDDAVAAEQRAGRP